MVPRFAWTKQAYESSVSSRCWCFVPYDGGWSGSGRKGEDPSVDDELAQIVAMELELGPLPDWVRRVVEGPIRWTGFCGHYLFPLPFLDAVDAIGAQRAPTLNHTCYTVERKRKQRMMDYALCLDAWLAGADPARVAEELMVRDGASGAPSAAADPGAAGMDWKAICKDIWEILGERTELKDLLIERMLHRTRWWLKATVWDDDRGTEYCRDEYLGDWRDSDPLIAENGNPDFRRGGFDEGSSPRVQRLEKRLEEICPDWDRWFRPVILECSWPCAPKAFRFMEKTLWCIGRERPVISLPSWPLDEPEEVPSFLQCRDDCPNQDAAAEWWNSFLDALRGWWRGSPGRGDVAKDVNRRLGEPSAVKRWLVRLLIRRLEVLAAGHLRGMVNAPSSSGRGAGTIP